MPWNAIEEQESKNKASGNNSKEVRSSLMLILSLFFRFHGIQLNMLCKQHMAV